MLRLEPFERTVIEISNRFQADGRKQDNWEVAQDIVQQIGGTAVNVAGTSLLGDEIGWALSSMSDAWLTEYDTKKYYLVDPFIIALTSGNADVMTDCGTLSHSHSAYELNHGLKTFGYGSLFASTSGSLSSGYRSMVVFCSDHTLAQVDADIGFGRLKIIHAIIAANIPRQDEGDIFAGTFIKENSLTVKESDVLSWLACGLRNDQIAFKLNIAEVTVRKHLSAIRLKLGAVTREQAIAIAVRDGWITL